MLESSSLGLVLRTLPNCAGLEFGGDFAKKVAELKSKAKLTRGKKGDTPIKVSHSLLLPRCHCWLAEPWANHD
jgi:hypothetical protein